MIIEMACNIKLQAIFYYIQFKVHCTFIQGPLNEDS